MATGEKREVKLNYKVISKARFTGRINVYEPWFRFMEEGNFRLYYGGYFQTKKNKTEYVGGGLSLHLRVEEVCYFEFVSWIKDLGYSDVGELWFRKRSCTLHNGRVQIKNDEDVKEFLKAPEKDGYYHLYSIMPNKATNVRNAESCVEGDVSKEVINNSMSGPESGCGVENPRSKVPGQTLINSSFLPPRPKSATNTSTTPSSPTFRCKNTTVSWFNNLAKTASKLPIVSQGKRQQVYHPHIPSTSNIPLPSENVLNHDQPPSEEDQFEAVYEDDFDDAELSDNDFEDREDDDIFNEFIDQEVGEGEIISLGGLREEENTGDKSYEGNDEGDFTLPEDQELVDSDGEAGSLGGSDDDEPSFPVFNPDVDFKGKVELCVGLKFPSPSVFRKALQFNAIDKSYNFYYMHNSNKRISVYCAKRCNCEWKKSKLGKCKCDKKKKCRFKVHVRKLKQEESWQIKSYRPNHICGRQTVNPKLTSLYLAERYIDDFREDPNLKVKKWMLRARRECKVEIGYHKAYYAKKIALKMIFGNADLEYERVWDYVAAVRKYNPGSTPVVKVEGADTPQPMFQRMYICLQACKEGFMAGCRKILGVDGAHLKGVYPGILLTAVGKDGNNNIFPVAWAVVEVENKESWSWFLELLKSDLHSVADAITWVHELEPRDNEDENNPQVTYMSDRQKGLIEAFTTILPNAETRYCCRHIWSNFKNKFEGELYRHHFWKAARASTRHHFNKEMEAIKKINVKAHKYLADIPASHWSRHAFKTSSKSGMLLNNCCESFNNVLRDARSRPILQLMEWIRRYVMNRACAKREGLKKYEGVIMPSVVKMITKGLEQVMSMRVTQADLVEFEVDHDYDTYVVNLETWSCSCYRWSLMGIPCWHALACIQKMGFEYENYIHPAYHISTYTATYAPSFHAMPGATFWDPTPYPKPRPPPYRKMPGRPSSKKRKKQPGEDSERRQVQRAKKQNQCGRCGGLGHYRSTCKNPPANRGPSSSTSQAQHNSQASSQLPSQLDVSRSAPQLLSQE